MRVIDVEIREEIIIGLFGAEVGVAGAGEWSRRGGRWGGSFRRGGGWVVGGGVGWREEGCGGRGGGGVGEGLGAAAVSEEGVDAHGGRGEVLRTWRGIEKGGGAWRGSGGAKEVPCAEGAAVGEEGVYEGEGGCFVEGGGGAV